MPRSMGERLWWTAGGLGAFFLVLVGWFLLINPQRARTSDTENQVTAARQQNVALQGRINSLRAQNAHRAKYDADLKQAQLALPSQSGVSDFLRTLQSIGNSTSTDVQALTVGAPVSINMTPPGAAPTPTPTPTTTSPAPAAGAAPVAVPGVYGLPITAQVAGSPAALGQFLQQLQAVQPRAVLITKLTEGAGAATQAKTAGTALQLTMQAFVDTSQTPVATNTSPTPSASPTAPN